MKLKHVHYGTRATVRLVSIVRPDDVVLGQEVSLRRDASGQWVLIHGGEHYDVTPDRDDDAQKLDSHDVGKPRTLTWVAAIDETKRGVIVTAVIQAFHGFWEPEDPIEFGIDETIVAKVAKLSNRGGGMSAALEWLKEHFFIESIGSTKRIVIIGSADKQKSFRALGAGFAMDVTTTDGCFRVKSLVKPNKKQEGLSRPETLVTGLLGFADSSTAEEVRAFVLESARALTESANRIYLRIWMEYQHLEESQLRRRSSALGWASYSSYEPKENGRYRFRIKDGDLANGFLSRLGDSEQLEAGPFPPDEAIGRNAEDIQDGPRPFVGTVTGYDLKRLMVELAPLDSDAARIPLPKGYLYLAMTGDESRLKRRNQAIERMLSGSAANPHLIALLEGIEMPLRRRPAAPPMSKAVRDLFRHSPTQSQREAIDIAVNTPDIALIQGPPGTGKTTVIAAIVTRLNELGRLDSARWHGRTLLSSFQHDALDNAIDRVALGSLPPARFGGKLGRRSGEEQLNSWLHHAREHVRASLAALPEDRPRELYRDFLRRVATYASGRGPRREGQRILQELLALDPSPFSTDVLVRLGEAGQPRLLPGSELERREYERCVRRLPDSNAMFSDDGPIHAERFLERFRSDLSPDDMTLLEAAAESDGEEFSLIDALAALKFRLLDGLADQKPISGHSEAHDPATVEALQLALDDWQRHLRTSHQSGIADALSDYLEALVDSTDTLLTTLRAYSPVYAATCQQAVGRDLAELVSQGTNVEFENVIVDEAARANPLDLLIPMSLSTGRVILVGDHRQLPHMLEPEVERELEKGDHGEVTQTLRQSLFERLFTDLRQRESKDGVRRVITLDQQFRMHPRLGRFVSDTFYEPNNERFSSPRPAGEFAHAIEEWQRDGAPVPAVWQNIERARGRETRQGSSWLREAEAEWIARRCRKLLDTGDNALSMGVITFYSAQVQAILRAFRAEGIARQDDDGSLDILEQYRWGDVDGRRFERLRVGTVDAFQGMEFDIVFLSVVRCNDLLALRAEDARRRFGHLTLANRLCVAMSRQKRLLVTVGDSAMFDGELARDHVPGLYSFLQLCRSNDGLVA